MKKIVIIVLTLFAIECYSQDIHQSYERGNLAWVFPDLYFFGAEHGYDDVFIPKYYLNDAILISESNDSLQIALSLADHEHSQQQNFVVTEFKKRPINENQNLQNVQNLLPISPLSHERSQQQTTVVTDSKKKQISKNQNLVQIYKIAKTDTLSFYVEPWYYIANDKLWVNDTFEVYISNHPESSAPWSIKFETRDVDDRLTGEGNIKLLVDK